MDIDNTKMYCLLESAKNDIYWGEKVERKPKQTWWKKKTTTTKIEMKIKRYILLFRIISFTTSKTIYFSMIHFKIK